MQRGLFYHIYNRGINRTPIFFDDKNYDFFLLQFNKYLSDYVDVYAYCLMPNHFHFLIKVRDFELNINYSEQLNKTSTRKLTKLEKAFRDLFISYSKSINKAYDRTGALFQARFKRRAIINEEYLIRLVPYIHMNPVRSGLCINPGDWKYSSYNSIISNKKTRIRKSEVMSWFGNIDSYIDYHRKYRDYQKERDFLFKNEK